MPTFATAHTFCASRDGPSKSGFLTAMPAKERYFCAVCKYSGKADFGKGYLDPKRKLGVTTHFSEILKLQFGKNCHALLDFLVLLELLLLIYL